MGCQTRFRAGFLHSFMDARYGHAEAKIFFFHFRQTGLQGVFLFEDRVHNELVFLFELFHGLFMAPAAPDGPEIGEFRLETGEDIPDLPHSGFHRRILHLIPAGHDQHHIVVAQIFSIALAM